jgi:farnesyl-diphosphate farnesyltransferase
MPNHAATPIIDCHQDRDRRAPSSPLPDGLDLLLRRTSRSIYLTLKAAPRAMRRPLMLGYLFCRAADTIADTRALPPERRIELLSLYRAQFAGAPDGAALEAIARAVVDAAPGAGGDAGFSAAEADLLRRLDRCFAEYRCFGAGDRALFDRLLATLTQGMEMDLARFPGEERARAEGAVGVLESTADLDRYTYHVAGCVGEFWTDLAFAHLGALRGLDRPALRDLAVRFGKGLQMVNILRDLPQDLAIGRCYLPRALLAPAGLDAATLRRATVLGDAEARRAALVPFRSVLDGLLDLTLDQFSAGWRYALAMPRRAPRLRLACAWPLLIGYATLGLLRAHPERLLAGERLKVSRGRVYRLIAASTALAFSNRALDALRWSLERQAIRSTRRESPPT